MAMGEDDVVMVLAFGKRKDCTQKAECSKKTRCQGGEIMTEQVKKRNSIDMLNGPLPLKIVLFAIPLALSSILQQLFNSADAIIAGQYIGSSALAAVGGVAPIISLFIATFVGLSIGSNVLIAIYIGRGEPEQIRGGIQTTVVVALVCSCLMTVVGILATDPILEAVNVPSDAWEEARQYLHVYFAGVVFFVVYNFGSAILRAKGDTKRPLYALALSVVLNIVLNFVAVVGFDGGVTGIALATVLANAVSAGVVVFFLLHEEETFRLTFSDFCVKHSDVRALLYIGVPAALQGAVFALSNVVIQGAINSFGTDATAGSAAAMNYEYYTYFFTSAFSQAAVTFVGQNYAAKKYDRCDSTMKFCMGAAVGITLALSLLFVGLGDISLGVFSTEAGALSYGAIRMWHVELLECMPCSYEITAAGMRGMGWSILPTVIVIVGSCLLRIVYVLVIFPAIASFENLMLIYPVTWTVTGSVMIALFFIARKRAWASAS